MSEADVAGWIQIAVIAAVFIWIIDKGDGATDPGICVKHQKPKQWRGWYPGEKKSFCDECEWERIQDEQEQEQAKK